MKLLFLFSLAARATLIPLVSFWGVIGLGLLADAPLERAVDFTVVWTSGFALALFALYAVVRKQPRVVERVSRGPAMLHGHSIPVLLVGMASGAGGVWLISTGNSSAGLCAGALGLLVAALETTSLLGSIFWRTPPSPH
jgi:hypothetical protein